MNLVNYLDSILVLATYIFISSAFYYILKMVFYNQTWHSFVPIYRYYIMYKIYAYRVYKKDFSKWYLFALVGWFVTVIAVTTIAISSNLSQFTQAAQGKVIIDNLVNTILILSIPITIIFLIGDLGILLPIFQRKNSKIIFIVVIIFEYILKLIRFRYVSSGVGARIFDFSFTIIDFIFALVIFVVAVHNFKKWRKGECSVVQITTDNEVIKRRHYSLF